MEGASQVLKFTYRNWRGEVAERTVTPIRIFFGTSPHHTANSGAEDAERNREQWYLVGWCHDRKDWRYFAMTAILPNIGRTVFNRERQDG